MVLDQFKLDGKVAVVTGAGRGIGQAYAIGLASPASDYMTGYTYACDGGWLAR